MQEKSIYGFSRLTSDFADVITADVIEKNGIIYQSKQPPKIEHYSNTAEGRKSFEDANYPENVKTALWAFWGESPTIQNRQITQR